MRRYLPLCFIAFFILIFMTVLAVNIHLAGYAGNGGPQSIKNITVYTTLQPEIALSFIQEYEKTANIKVNIVPLSEADLLIRLKVETGNQQADLVLTNQTVLQQLARNGELAAYFSAKTDLVPNKFKDSNNYWTGLWYDPLVFAVNREKANGLQPLNQWNDLINKNIRIALTDFLASESSANLLYTFSAVYGEEYTLNYFKTIHQQVVQYSKFLATPVRLAAMGEVDLAIASQSETIKYINDGFPVNIIYPEEGTAGLLIGIGIIKGSQQYSNIKPFIDWLLLHSTDILEKNRYYVVPTNPEARLYQYFITRNIKLLDAATFLTIEQQSKLLDKWVKAVRLTYK